MDDEFVDMCLEYSRTSDCLSSDLESCLLQLDSSDANSNTAVLLKRLAADVTNNFNNISLSRIIDLLPRMPPPARTFLVIKVLPSLVNTTTLSSPKASALWNLLIASDLMESSEDGQILLLELLCTLVNSNSYELDSSFISSSTVWSIIAISLSASQNTGENTALNSMKAIDILSKLVDFCSIGSGSVVVVLPEIAPDGKLFYWDQAISTEMSNFWSQYVIAASCLVAGVDAAHLSTPVVDHVTQLCYLWSRLNDLSSFWLKQLLRLACQNAAVAKSLLLAVFREATKLAENTKLLSIFGDMLPKLITAGGQQHNLFGVHRGFTSGCPSTDLPEVPALFSALSNFFVEVFKGSDKIAIDTLLTNWFTSLLTINTSGTCLAYLLHASSCSSVGVVRVINTVEKLQSFRCLSINHLQSSERFVRPFIFYSVIKFFASCINPESVPLSEIMSNLVPIFDLSEIDRSATTHAVLQMVCHLYGESSLDELVLESFNSCVFGVPYSYHALEKLTGMFRLSSSSISGTICDLCEQKILSRLATHAYLSIDSFYGVIHLLGGSAVAPNGSSYILLQRSINDILRCLTCRSNEVIEKTVHDRRLLIVWNRLFTNVNRLSVDSQALINATSSLITFIQMNQHNVLLATHAFDLLNWLMDFISDPSIASDIETELRRLIKESPTFVSRMIESDFDPNLYREMKEVVGRFFPKIDSFDQLLRDLAFGRPNWKGVDESKALNIFVATLEEDSNYEEEAERDDFLLRKLFKETQQYAAVLLADQSSNLPNGIIEERWPISLEISIVKHFPQRSGLLQAFRELRSASSRPEEVMVQNTLDSIRAAASLSIEAISAAMLVRAIMFGQNLRRDNRLVIESFNVFRRLLFENDVDMAKFFNGVELSVPLTASLVRAAAMKMLAKLSSDRIHNEISTRLAKAYQTIVESNASKRAFSSSLMHRQKNRALGGLLASLNKTSDVKSIFSICWPALTTAEYHTSCRILLQWICLYLIKLSKDQGSNDLVEELSRALDGAAVIIGDLPPSQMGHAAACSLCDIAAHLPEEEALEDRLLALALNSHFATRNHSLAALLHRWKNVVPSSMLPWKNSVAKSANVQPQVGKIRQSFFFKLDPLSDSTSAAILLYWLPLLSDLATDEVTLPQDLEKSDFDTSKRRFGDNNSMAVVHSSEALEEAAGNSKQQLQRKFFSWRKLVPQYPSCLDDNEDSKVGAAASEERRWACADLILVASLIDKPTNLGGLCRSAEVFGLSTVVLSSLEFAKHKEFQSLSVTGHNFLKLVEVSERRLVDYLLEMRSEGYNLVAAEQSTGSVSLSGFSFPKKTVLILGNERQGIPPHILQMVDVCVEVPQCGVAVRSLNVHVTGALFIYSYFAQFGCTSSAAENR